MHKVHSTFTTIFFFSHSGNYHTSYYKEGHVERTGGIDKKLFFGAKGSVYDDPEGGSLGDQRGVSDLV